MVKKKELIKKSLLVGAGLAAIAKDRADKLVKEMLKKGHINQAQGKKLVKSVVSEATKSGLRVAKVVETELGKVMNAAGVKAPKKVFKKKVVKKKPVKKKATKKKTSLKKKR
jgi:polyhydroxyalkanoate synthesis regulator phasin